MKISHFIRRFICILIALKIIDIVVAVVSMQTINNQLNALCIAFTMMVIGYYILPKSDKNFIHTIKNNLSRHRTYTFKKTPVVSQQMTYQKRAVDISKQQYQAQATPYLNELSMLKRQLDEMNERIESQKAYRNQLSKQINELNIKYQQLNELTTKHDSLVEDIKLLQEQKDQLADAHVTDEYQSFMEYQSKQKLATIDNFDGYQFETFTCDLLKALGFSDIKRTQGSSDFGVDVYAKNGDTSYVFQCKLYASPVGIKAVQEANSGRSYYNCKKAVVITNSYFTPHAISASEKLDIDLWNRDKLASLIAEANV
ncbi:hypothetical protein ERK14_06380 [Lactobacillus kunkeei]|uniref:Restriction endonuclease n=1 Tax=Apilactobacillus nanyangensis TaxID=2799579 RepID=A0ABT0HYS3_9LACO|nr:hypothetical protein [Apilactobacillus kunkeei]MCK8612083.1 restriction endonuclease [Apilactobacillus nanyangensis]TMT02624.1 hypothetical protein FD687_01500 [Apilactobacillus kunkeei]TMT04183.1 hypothetical protein FD689_01585 [Apilactobacillus kunkeei]CAI2610897.1 hypothetical protein AKUA1404_00970 [Apilactobacillus kunkeei]